MSETTKTQFVIQGKTIRKFRTQEEWVDMGNPSDHLEGALWNSTRPQGHNSIVKFPEEIRIIARTTVTKVNEAELPLEQSVSPEDMRLFRERLEYLWES